MISTKTASMRDLQDSIYSNKEEVPLGAGFWAFRRTISKAGKGYTKLVKRDRSPSGTVYALVLQKRVPSIGHNPRRARILAKRAAKIEG